jgi:hypothetical protein
MKALAFLWPHRTKILGFLQITFAQMMGWQFLSPVTVSILTTANGLLTVWVGFMNSRASKDAPL